MKTLISVYLLIMSVLGAYFSAYVLFDEWFAPLFLSSITVLICQIYHSLQIKEINKAAIVDDITTKKYEKIPVIGKKPIDMEEYRSKQYDLPDVPWHKPMIFDMAKAYYEPRKPL